MTENTSYRAFEFLSERLRFKIREVALYTKRNGADNETVIDTLNDFNWLTGQQFIASMTTQAGMKQVLNMLETTGKEWSRIDFILKVTTELKLWLGDENWNKLIKDIIGAFRYTTTDLSLAQQRSGMSLLNRQVLQIDTEVLDANHWLVPIILYGTNAETAVLISDEIDNIRMALSYQTHPTRK